LLRFVDDTAGQADTAAIGARWASDLQEVGPIVFHNVDTVVEGRDLPRIGRSLETSDGHIDTFRSASPAFSYVAVDEDSRVLEIVEKRVISPHATTGLYGFRSPAAYLAWRERASATAGEFYVSDVYRAVLAAGGRVLAGTERAPSHRTTVLGTPAEYEAAVAAEGALSDRARGAP
jgi:hypothetical protein